MNNEQRPTSLAERQLSEDILELGEALIGQKENDIVTIDEARFVAVFLPMFAQDEVQHYLQHGATIMGWQQLAGGPFNEVRVVNAKGEEIFRVPALFNADAMKPLDGKNTPQGMASVTDMIKRADMIAKQGPGAYNAFMESEFQRREFMFKDKSHEVEYVARWNAIRARYNRPLISVNGVTPGSAAPVVRPIDHDSSEFEAL